MSARHNLPAGSIDDMNSWMLVDDDNPPRPAPVPVPALPPHDLMNDRPAWMPPPPPGHAWLVPVPPMYPPIDPPAWLANFLPRPLPIPAPAIHPPTHTADAPALQPALPATHQHDLPRPALNPTPPADAYDFLSPDNFSNARPVPLPADEDIDMLVRTREGAPSPRSIGFMSPPPAYRRYPIGHGPVYGRNINPMQDLAADVGAMHVEARGHGAVAHPETVLGSPASQPIAVPNVAVPPPMLHGPLVDNVWARMLNAAVVAQGGVDDALHAFRQIARDARPGVAQPNGHEHPADALAMDVEIGAGEQMRQFRNLSPDSTLGEDVAGVDEALGAAHAQELAQDIAGPPAPDNNGQPSIQQLATKLDQIMDIMLAFNSDVWSRLERIEESIENLERQGRGRRGARRPRPRNAGAEAETWSVTSGGANDSPNEPDADSVA